MTSIHPQRQDMCWGLSEVHQTHHLQRNDALLTFGDGLPPVGRGGRERDPSSQPVRSLVTGIDCSEFMIS
jgi:hypothetical protein